MHSRGIYPYFHGLGEGRFRKNSVDPLGTVKDSHLTSARPIKHAPGFLDLQQVKVSDQFLQSLKAQNAKYKSYQQLHFPVYLKKKKATWRENAAKNEK